MWGFAVGVSVWWGGVALARVEKTIAPLFIVPLNSSKRSFADTGFCIEFLIGSKYDGSRVFVKKP